MTGGCTVSSRPCVVRMHTGVPFVLAFYREAVRLGCWQVRDHGGLALRSSPQACPRTTGSWRRDHPGSRLRGREREGPLVITAGFQMNTHQTEKTFMA